MSRWALLLVLAAVLGACDDAFSPRADDGRAFAIYGTLDGGTTRQALRVQDLAGSVLTTPDQLPVTVTSTELSTDRTTVWRDSLVTLPDGLRAHLFVADLAVAPGDVHRIKAVRDADGATSVVTVAVPTFFVSSGTPPPSSIFAAPVVPTVRNGRVSGVLVRFVVRRPDTADGISFLTQPLPQESARGVSYLSYLDAAELRATTLLYGIDSDEPVVFVDARLEGSVTGTESTPVEGGVGGVGWAYPISASIPFTNSAITQVGFVDGR